MTTRALRWLVAIVAMAFLVRAVGAADVLQALRAIHPLAVLSYAALFVGVPFLYGVQVHGGLRRLGYTPPRSDVMRATVESWSVGTLTPARAGDLSLGFLLGADGPRTDATALVVVDKVVSLLVLAALAIVSTAVGQVPYGQAVIVATSWLIGGALSLFALVALPGPDATSRALARRVLGVRGQDTWDALRRIGSSRRVLAWSAGLAALRWGYVCVANLVLFWGVGATPGLGLVTAATAVGRIISIVPVTIGGLGVKEPVQIVMYAGAGVPAESVIAVSVVGMACGFAAAAAAPPLARALFRPGAAA